MIRQITMIYRQRGDKIQTVCGLVTVDVGKPIRVLSSCGELAGDSVWGELLAVEKVVLSCSDEVPLIIPLSCEVEAPVSLSVFGTLGLSVIISLRFSSSPLSFLRTLLTADLSQNCSGISSCDSPSLEPCLARF